MSSNANRVRGDARTLVLSDRFHADSTTLHDSEDAPPWLWHLGWLTEAQDQEKDALFRWRRLMWRAPVSKTAKLLAAFIADSCGENQRFCWPGFATIGHATGINSANTIDAGLDELAAAGLLRIGYKLLSDSRKMNYYFPSWPAGPPMLKERPKCGAPTERKRGSGEKACGRRAGWGTNHQGVGACKLHCTEHDHGDAPTPSGLRGVSSTVESMSSTVESSALNDREHASSTNELEVLISQELTEKDSGEGSAPHDFSMRDGACVHVSRQEMERNFVADLIADGFSETEALALLAQSKDRSHAS